MIHRGKNGGAAAARNEGLFQGSGKYIYYVDGDDWIARDLLEKAHSILDREGAADIFVFCYVRVRENGRYEKRELKVEAGLYDKEQLKKKIYPVMICKVEKSIKEGIDSGSLCDKIIKKELLEKHYCRDLSLFCGEDSVCAWECMYFAKKIYFSNLYFYNCVNSDSSTKKYHADLYENNRTVAGYLRMYLTEKKDLQIDQQINALEFRGIVRAVQQEVYFRHSFCHAARFLKKKCKDKKVICFVDGLPNNVYPYIWLLNLKCFKILFVMIILKYCIERILHFIKKLSHVSGCLNTNKIARRLFTAFLVTRK